jgi:hypothetical protein
MAVIHGQQRAGQKQRSSVHSVGQKIDGGERELIDIKPKLARFGHEERIGLDIGWWTCS